MPNNTQIELLESFLSSSNGIYFEVIKEDKKFDLGTKVLYLERALKQDCNLFLVSLDKLYNPELKNIDHVLNIEFIRAFKFINDLYHNNKIKYGDYGVRSALIHCFGSLGAVDEKDFKATIDSMIHTAIAELCSSSQQAELLAQKTAREAAESNILRHSGWRLILDLPQDQLTPELLSPTIDWVDVGLELFNLLKFIQEVPLDELTLSGINRFISNYQRMINDSLQIPINELMAITGPTRITFFIYLPEIGRMVRAGIPFANLALLSGEPDKLSSVILFAEQVAKLVTDLHVPAADLLALDNDRLATLCNHYIGAHLLIHELHCPIGTLFSYDHSEFFGMLHNAEGIKELINKLSIPLSEIIAIDYSKRLLLLYYAKNVIPLIEEENVNLEQLINLSTIDLRTLLSNLDSNESQGILHDLQSSARLAF